MCASRKTNKSALNNYMYLRQYDRETMNQYLICVLRFLRHAAYQFFAHLRGDLIAPYSLNNAFKSPKLDVLSVDYLVLRIDQRFSIGFKSGLCPGYGQRTEYL